MLLNASSSRRSTSGRGLATAPDGSIAPDRPPSSGCAARQDDCRIAFLATHSKELPDALDVLGAQELEVNESLERHCASMMKHGERRCESAFRGRKKRCHVFQ
jgi:hypothetical protein